MSLINGRTHDWEDVKIYLNGVPVADVKEINYRDAREADMQYSQGSAPHSVSYGNYSAEGDITLTVEEYIKFARPALALGRSVYDYAPFAIIIAYADKKKKTEGDPPRDYVVQEFSPTKIETILDVVLTNRDQAAAQNDKDLSRKLTFKARKIIM